MVHLYADTYFEFVIPWLRGALLVYFSFFLMATVEGQVAIEGKVIDAETREPLAFVNVFFNANNQTGTVTDINGQFRYSSPDEINTLTLSYVGYGRKTISMDSLRHKHKLVFRLEPTAFSFEEVVVKAGENPANRIIRRVIENRKINNPENISSFTYTSYNKVVYDFDFIGAPEHDSLQLEMNEVLKGGHVLMMESVTERKFMAPDISEEVIIGVKVSGFKNPSFAPLATDLQPFSFYREIIPIFDINYLNPISDGSLSKYDFRIEDTLYQQQDTTFILSFKPQQGKNYEALKGLLYINTSTYAIQNVIAEPFDQGFITIKLQQQYQRVDGRQWFPEQLNFEIFVTVESYEDVGMRANGKSHIKDVQLHAGLSRKEFSIDMLRTQEGAARQDTLFWNHHRADPLTEEELTTYQVMDSLGMKYKFDRILTYAEKLASNRIPIGIIDLDISKSLIFNLHEGLRLGLGAYTNDKLVKNLSLGGYFGYGLKDHNWKYGSEIIWTVNKQNEFQIRGKYENTLAESGKTKLNFYNARQFDWRSYLATQMDQMEQSSLSFGLRAFRYARINVSFNHTYITPLYAYWFQPDEQPMITNFTNTDFTVNVRYAFREKLISTLDKRISMGTKYPVLSFYYTRGMHDVFGGQFAFNKFEARIDESFFIKNVGQSKIRMEAGFIDQPLPYALLFTGEGSFVRGISVLVPNYFQTTSLYEFLSDRYVNVFFSHTFGSLLFHAGKFKPSLTVVQNIGWGKLSNPEFHQGISFNTKEKGLYESGLQLDNLIKLNYLNVAYWGFGVGAYYRYGPYATSNAGDNMAFKISMTFTTK